VVVEGRSGGRDRKRNNGSMRSGIANGISFDKVIINRNR